MQSLDLFLYTINSTKFMLIPLLTSYWFYKMILGVKEGRECYVSSLFIAQLFFSNYIILAGSIFEWKHNIAFNVLVEVIPLSFNLFFLFKGSVLKKIASVLLYYVIGALGEVIMLIPMHIYDIHLDSMFGSYYLPDLAYLISSLVISLIYYFRVYKKEPPERDYLRLATAIIPLAGLQFMSLLYYFFSYEFTFALAIFIFLLIVTTCFLYGTIRRNREKKRELQMLQKSRDYYCSQCELILEHYKKTSQFRHDIKKYHFAEQMYLVNGEYEKLEETYREILLHFEPNS